MKVLVTADTHIPEWYGSLPNELLDAARRSDMILLAGDIVGPEVIDTLNGCAPVEAVYGNECYPDLKKSLPPKKVLTAGKWKIGLTHGHLGEGISIDEKAISLFDEKLDILVHGHSHHHRTEVVKDTLVLDPGSPIDTRFTDTHSFAILTLDDEPRVEFRIIP